MCKTKGGGQWEQNGNIPQEWWKRIRRRDSFLLWALDGPAGMMPSWNCSSLKGKKWFWNMVINGTSGCRAHETARFEILKGVRKERSREQILDFR